MDLTGFCGVPWSMKKMRPLASIQQYIGFDWNLESHTVTLPAERLSKSLSLLDTWLAPNGAFSARDATSLHGKLVHISCIFPIIRPFLRGSAHFAHSFKSPLTKMPIFLPLQAILSWVQFIIRSLPNEIPLASPEPINLQWWGDASMSFGVGIALGSYWAVWKWAPGFVVGPQQAYDIGWAEAVMVEFGLHLSIDLNLFSITNCQGGSFLVHSDNAGIIAVANKGRSRSHETNKILKHIYLLQAQHHIQLKTTHVTSHDDISDGLSHGAIDKFLTSFPSVNIHTSILLPDHLSDKLISL